MIVLRVYDPLNCTESKEFFSNKSYARIRIELTIDGIHNESVLLSSSLDFRNKENETFIGPALTQPRKSHF